MYIQCIYMYVSKARTNKSGKSNGEENKGNGS